jgi:hypothetical protein
VVHLVVAGSGGGGERAVNETEGQESPEDAPEIEAVGRAKGPELTGKHVNNGRLVRSRDRRTRPGPGANSRINGRKKGQGWLRQAQTVGNERPAVEWRVSGEAPCPPPP